MNCLNLILIILSARSACAFLTTLYGGLLV